MKQIITATASLILILYVFSNMLCIQEIKMKQTELKVCSVKYIEQVKKEGGLNENIRTEWRERISKIFNCGADKIVINSAERNYHEIKLVEIDVRCDIEQVKESFGISKGKKEIKAHYDIKCDK